MIKPSTSLPVTKAVNTALAPNFSPGRHDVVCSRGKRTYRLNGKKNFRQLIDEHLKVYTHAQTRAEKSTIIIAIRRIHPILKKSKSYVEIGHRPRKRCYYCTPAEDYCGLWEEFTLR